MGPLRLPAADPGEDSGLGAPVSSAFISTVKPVPHFLQVVRLPRISSRTVYFCPQSGFGHRMVIGMASPVEWFRGKFLLTPHEWFRGGFPIAPHPTSLCSGQQRLPEGRLRSLSIYSGGEAAVGEKGYAPSSDYLAFLASTRSSLAMKYHSPALSVRRRRNFFPTAGGTVTANSPQLFPPPKGPA